MLWFVLGLGSMLSILPALRCRGKDNSCCTSETPCGFGDGDCDSDDQCAGDMVCGDNNCPKNGFEWNGGDDCCVKRKKKCIDISKGLY